MRRSHGAAAVRIGGDERVSLGSLLPTVASSARAEHPCRDCRSRSMTVSRQLKVMCCSASTPTGPRGLSFAYTTTSPRARVPARRFGIAVAPFGVPRCRPPAGRRVPIQTYEARRAAGRVPLNTAVRWRLVSKNAVVLVDSPRAATREIRPLTPDEAKQLLKAAASQPLDAFVAIALGCGSDSRSTRAEVIRRGFLEAGTLRVRHALQRSGGDTLARRPLLIERERLRQQLQQEQSAEQRRALLTHFGRFARSLKH